VIAAAGHTRKRFGIYWFDKFKYEKIRFIVVCFDGVE
jgi:hypothetical protein